MKKQFVSSLQEGDVVNDYFVAARKDLRDTQSGGKFLGMVFKDRSGEIGGVLWNKAKEVSGLFELGDVVNVRGTVNTYQSRLQVRVDQVLPLRDGEYALEDLIAAASDSGKSWEAFREILETIEDPWLRALVDSFLNDEDFVERFSGAAAGKRWHHSFRGGLMRHCYEMLRLAETLCELFPKVRRDLLLTGILVHDVGKLEEMTHGLLVDYTTGGKLMGHLVQGCLMVGAKIEAIEGFPAPLKEEVFHLVLSHHGELENGSPILPKTVEAVALYFIDNLDAQTDAFIRIGEETQEKGQEWSDFIAMINRPIYSPRR